MELTHLSKSCCWAYSCSEYQPNGAAPISSTNKPITGGQIILPSGEMVDFAPPRALTTEEVEAIAHDFRLAARNAINAGTFLAARSKQTRLS